MTASPALDLDDFPALFAAAPAALLVLRPDAPVFTIVGATDAYLQATLQSRDALVGRSVFEALPDANPGNLAPTGVANLRARSTRCSAPARRTRCRSSATTCAAPTGRGRNATGRRGTARSSGGTARCATWCTTSRT
ncbi:hypothetical protein rosag_34930 [Roseisolibacter agri]|uniref:Uncharacterized protein n=1 Tax=Roseisolibacter agri TaxID=2014610 RepID=A0AA37V1Y3_9BACT|nr:hypothetical protein rosag_34930 [Roseisolibacter agri]